MELNKLGRAQGVVVTEDIVEGRAVVLTEHGLSYDFGSWEDLPGAKLPETAAEAGLAVRVLMFAPDNREYPVYQPTPSYAWALRQGFDKAANTPFSATVYITPPGNYETPQTVPSGTLAVALGAGTRVTIPSTGYIANANIKVGVRLSVADEATDGASDAGKLKYTDGVTGAFEVLEIDDDGNLTVLIR